MPKTSETPDENYEKHISSLRNKLLEDLQQNLQTKQEEYDLEFVKRIQEDDDLLRRFLFNHHGNVDKALEQLKDVAKWRKEFGVKDLKLSNLNHELLKTSALYHSKCDHNGDPILMLAVNRITRNSDQNPDKQKIVVYLAEKLITEAPNNRITFMLDCQGVGVANMDLEMMVYITNCLIKYYPDCIGYVLVYNMPFLFNVIWQVIKALIPKQYKTRVKFVDKNSVREFIQPDCLPRRMGGQIPDYYDFDTNELKDKL